MNEELKYQEVVNAWAENRLGLRKGSVTKVAFGTEEQGYCETCSYTVSGAEVSYTVPNPKNKTKVSTKYAFIDLQRESFAEVLAEVLEVGKWNVGLT